MAKRETQLGLTMPSRNTLFSCNRHRHLHLYRSTLFGTLISLREQSMSEFSGYLLYSTIGLLMRIYCSDDCKKHWGRIQGHDSSGDDQSGGSGFQGGGSGQGSGPTPNIGEGCSLEVYILFGPRNWTNEPPLIIQFLLLVDALPITDFQKSEFRNVSSIRYFNPSIVRYNHRPGKQFVLVGYLSYATAKDFVEAWREYGEKDVVAVILGRE